ncbi:MAG: 3-oxoacyl-[Akkermansia sp.]|nr:3-oxoacyl-[acyl-carrier-protein] reductase [Akkermansiaceae bacterium]MBQ3143896.1 3-oxoacyl-[acyl-carrier-protein] reductase [Akkermansia sp.]
MNRLAGKTAVVTGAGRGIGQSVAQRFAAEGAKVILISRNPASCGNAADVINAEYPGSCKAFPCDVADAGAVENCVKEILAEYTTIDILVNNAGITKDGLLMRMKESDWDAVITTNLKSVFLFVKAFQRTLMKSPAGRIINLSSIVGMTGNVGQANYAASKAGVIGFTKSMAQEIASRKVTVNAIAPGFIATDMTDAIPEKAKEAMLARIPLGDLGKPEDIANCALFLASDEARYITGQVIVCDGGMTM